MKNNFLPEAAFFFKKIRAVATTIFLGTGFFAMAQPTIIVPFYHRLPDGVKTVPFPAGVRFALSNGAEADWSFSAAPLPPGISLVNRELVGTPTNGALASYNVVVTATKIGEANITRTYQWPIRNAPVANCNDAKKIALVLDLSGSMNLTYGAGAETRFQLLKRTVKSYLPMLASAISGMPAPANPNRLAVYFFNGATSNMRFEGNFVPSEWDTGDEVEAKLFMQPPPAPANTPVQPSGATPIGAGLLSAINFLNTGPLGSVRNIVLFTDGLQNVPPMVVSPGFETIEPAINLNSGDNAGIKILTIGAANAQAPMLNLLANPDNWFANDEIISNASLNTFFTTTIALALRDCSPRIVDLRNSSLAGFDQWTADTFAISRFVDKLTFRTTVFSNDSDDVLSDDFELWKDGQQLSKQFVKTFFENKSLRFEVDLPIPTGPMTYMDEAGKWVVRVRGTKGAEYESLCLAEDKYLETDLTAGGLATRYAGDEIPVEAKLQFAGRGIDNAVVRAILLKPGEDLGDLAARRNVAAKNLTIAEPPASNSTAANSQALGQAKLDFLLSQPDFIQKLEKEKRIINLISTGGGTYRGNFPGGDQTQNTGTYRVVALFDGTADGPKTFESWESRCVYLDFSAPDDIMLVPSLVYVGKCGDGKPQKPCYQMAFTPVNKFGKRLGPAQAPRIQVKVGKPTPIDLIDNLDGSYSTVVFEKPDGDPAVSIFVGDPSKPVFESQISRLQKHFGVSAHVGMTIPRSELDTMFNNSGYAELDFTYRFGKNRAWQASAVGGFYAFEKDFNIVGARAQVAHLFNRSDLPGVQFRLGAGAGYYVPKNEVGIIGYNLDAGAVWHFSPVADLSLDARYFVLDKKGYQFATLGAGAVFFF